MLVLSPFIAKIATKGSDAIFGKPTKSVLDEDKEPEKEAENKNNAQSTSATQEQKPINPNNIKSDTNLIKQAALEAEANKTQNNADKSQQADTNKTANSEDSKSIAKDEVSSNKDTNNTTNTRANSTTETNKADKNAPVMVNLVKIRLKMLIITKQNKEKLQQLLPPKPQQKHQQMGKIKKIPEKKWNR